LCSVPWRLPWRVQQEFPGQPYPACFQTILPPSP
jgi:hypothetical protein